MRDSACVSGSSNPPLRLVTPVYWETRSNCSCPSRERTLHSWSRYFSLRTCQCAGIRPSHGEPESRYAEYSLSALIIVLKLLISRRADPLCSALRLRYLAESLGACAKERAYKNTWRKRFRI